MAPKKKATSRPASRSASRSASQTPTASPRTSARLSAEVPPAPSKSPSLPAPDPSEVQRLINEAMARAQKNRAANGGVPPPMPYKVGSGKPGVAQSVISYLFGSRDCIFSHSATAVLTDAIGAFLVACIAIFFTTAGYLLYREIALEGSTK